MTLKKDFGLRLKKVRTKKGITQFQLAERVGIDAKHMSHIETGRSFPKADLIEKFAYALEIDYRELFCFEKIQDRETILNEISKLLQQAKDEELSIINRLIKDVLF